MPQWSNRSQSLASKTVVETLRRQEEAWERERLKLERQLEQVTRDREQLRKYLKQIQDACEQARLRNGAGRRVLSEQDREQLRKYLERIQSACRQALSQGRRRSLW